MKLIVLNKAMFKYYDELSIEKLTAFLISKGFYDVGDFHIDDAVFCTAEYDGKLKFDMPNIEAPEFYLHRIKTNGMDFLNRTAYNANMLNELCRRNGRER